MVASWFWGGARLPACWICAASLVSTAKADPALMERPPLAQVIFGSLDSGSATGFASVGVKRSLGYGGLDASGFRAGLQWGAGAGPARRKPDIGKLYRTQSHAQLGYEWRIADSFLALSVGAMVEAAYRETRDHLSLEHRRALRLDGEIWSRLARNWVLQASAYAVLADGNRYWARLATSWRVIGELYLGPELEAYRERDYHKVRLGMHLAGLHFLGLDWRLGAGFQTSRNEASGTYVTLGLHWKR